MKLHIGGNEVKKGWKILNIQKVRGVDFIGNISDLSQFKSESIDVIYASHVFEHVIHNKVVDTLKGIYRVLKKKGKFYISVPDMDILAKAFLNPNLSLEDKFNIMKIMFGGQVDQYDFHYMGWNEAFLASFLKRAGFKSHTRVQSFGIFNDDSDIKPLGFPISVNLIVYK